MSVVVKDYATGRRSMGWYVPPVRMLWADALNRAHPECAVHWDRDVGGEDLAITEVHLCMPEHEIDGDLKILLGPVEVICSNGSFYRYLHIGRWVCVRESTHVVSRTFLALQAIYSLCKGMRRYGYGE